MATPWVYMVTDKKQALKGRDKGSKEVKKHVRRDALNASYPISYQLSH